MFYLYSGYETVLFSQTVQRPSSGMNVNANWCNFSLQAIQKQ